MTNLERATIANNIERYMNRAAGVIRERIKEGTNLVEASQHDSVQFWVDAVEKEADRLTGQTDQKRV